MQAALSDFLIEIIVLQVGAIGSLVAYIYTRLRDDIEDEVKQRQKIEEDVVHLTEEVEKFHRHMGSMKRTMYGNEEDPTEMGHIYETEQRLDDLNASISQLRSDMKEEHKETKNALRSIMGYLRREEGDFNDEQMFDD